MDQWCKAQHHRGRIFRDHSAILPWSPGSVVFLTSAIGTGDLGSWPQADGASGVSAGDEIPDVAPSGAVLRLQGYEPRSDLPISIRHLIRRRAALRDELENEVPAGTLG